MFKAFIFLIVGSLFICCLLTPLVCELIYLFAGELPWPFSRVFDRVAMLSVLIMLMFCKKSFSLQVVKEYLKKGDFKSRVQQCSLGLILSLASAALIYWYLLVNNIVEVSLRETSYYIRKVPLVLLGAGLIALIEESFFRVVCYKNCKKFTGTIIAAFATSCLYASVHFIAPLKSFNYVQGEFVAGFVYLSAVLGNVFHPELLPAFTGLFIVGLILCFALERSASVYVCIGLHAGWVMAVKLVGYTSKIHLAYDSSLARRYILVSYPVTWLVLLVVVLLLYIIFRKRKV